MEQHQTARFLIYGGGGAFAVWSAVIDVSTGHPGWAAFAGFCAGAALLLLAHELIFAPIVRSLQRTIESQAETITEHDLKERRRAAETAARLASLRAEANDKLNGVIRGTFTFGRPPMGRVQHIPSCATCNTPWKAHGDFGRSWIKACACIPRGAVE